MQKIIKILSLLLIPISIVWLISSEDKYEPLIVLISSIAGFLSLTKSRNTKSSKFELKENIESYLLAIIVGTGVIVISNYLGSDSMINSDSRITSLFGRFWRVISFLNSSVFGFCFFLAIWMGHLTSIKKKEHKNLLTPNIQTGNSNSPSNIEKDNEFNETHFNLYTTSFIVGTIISDFIYPNPTLNLAANLFVFVYFLNFTWLIIGFIINIIIKRKNFFYQMVYASWRCILYPGLLFVILKLIDNRVGNIIIEKIDTVIEKGITIANNV